MTVTALYSGAGSSETASDPKNDTINGDVNSDGTVNSKDLVAVISVMSGTAKAENLKADVNGDGKVSILDLVLLKSRLLG